jgi:hypothetical protein
MMDHRRAAAIHFAVSLPFLVMIAGCSGQASMEFVSLNMSEIDPPPVKAWSFKASECYWWLEESGELNIAMRLRESNLLLGKIGNVDLAISFVFDSAPAGRARNYNITPRDVRSLYVSPLATQRWYASGGIVGVTIGRDGVLRGSYRLWMAPLMNTGLFSFMPVRPGSVLCFGTFEALRDEKRGTPIRAFSESNGYARPKKGATSRPSARLARLVVYPD